MEVETSRSHLNELFDHLVARDVRKNDVLVVLGQNCKAVRNSSFVRILFLAQNLLKVFPTV